jgi:23S rRNA pseudouridine2605 synthase
VNAKNDDLRRVGLARALSKMGYCPRSVACDLIRAGRVGVNGRIRRDPELPVCLPQDRFQVDGQELAPSRKLYLMMNKPRGAVTTAADEKGRATVYAFLETDAWVAPVGRLDKASEGLLLLTNDSVWAARVCSPETHLDKTYHVQVACMGDEMLIQKLNRGVEVNGQRLRAKASRIVRKGEKNTWLEIVLDEGKNRQIRRMLGALGIEVLRLIRIAIGPLILGDLAKGASRKLSAAEKGGLDAAMETSCRKQKRRQFVRRD